MKRERWKSSEREKGRSEAGGKQLEAPSGAGEERTSGTRCVGKGVKGKVEKAKVE